MKNVNYNKILGRYPTKLEKIKINNIISFLPDIASANKCAVNLGITEIEFNRILTQMSYFKNQQIVS